MAEDKGKASDDLLRATHQAKDLPASGPPYRDEATADQAEGRTPAEGELTTAERRDSGIEDNTRHTGSIGRR
jgi:hypothetical protein